MARWRLLAARRLKSDQDELVEMAGAIANKKVELDGRGCRLAGEPLNTCLIVRAWQSPLASAIGAQATAV